MTLEKGWGHRDPGGAVQLQSRWPREGSGQIRGSHDIAEELRPCKFRSPHGSYENGVPSDRREPLPAYRRELKAAAAEVAHLESEKDEFARGPGDDSSGVSLVFDGEAGADAEEDTRNSAKELKDELKPLKQQVRAAKER